jgi:DNA/RNA endonuclease G (NUC1)
VSIADFLANKYEGEYISIENVQVADSDLSKCWVMNSSHTSINIEDEQGNKFVVFSSKYATFGTESVAQGSGTIKGISSINNGTMQIIFAQKSDYAGLTGKRFGEQEEDNNDDSGNDNDNNDTTSGKRYRTGWYELPTEADANGDGRDDNNSTYYYAHHLCAGGEKNAQKSGKARNYSVCYSSEHHCPVWVAAPRHDMYEGSAKRTDAYGKDPDIPANIQYDSKSTGGGCNKGHMLGSAERTSSSATNKQVFYYTNIAPQYSSTFNTGGGAWNNLEDHIDGLVCSDTLYTVIGCYFDTYTDKYGNTGTPKKISFGGRSDVSRPTMFYYALLRTKSGKTGKSVKDCSASELQCAAFVICHEQDKGHKPQVKDLISIEELEQLTGFTYFENVPNAPKSTFNSSDWL